METNIFSQAVLKTLGQQFDKLVLYTINMRMPDSFDDSSINLSLEEVLSLTQVDREKTSLYSLLAPGEHPIYLDTIDGPVTCHVHVRLAPNPQAPLLIYHHGFAEIPYTSTWRRILPKSEEFSSHTVAVQAPFHNTLTEPIKFGFSSIQNIYQMFAGSLRIIELLQEQFEEGGTVFTVVSGYSWGGITSMLYEGIFQQARAVVPMFASPDLAQVLWDTSELLDRPLPIDRETLDQLLNFTSYYQNCDPERVFAVMGQDDLFFRYDHHSRVISAEALTTTVPTSHVGAVNRTKNLLNQHIQEAIEWAAQHPL